MVRLILLVLLVLVSVDAVRYSGAYSQSLWAQALVFAGPLGEQVQTFTKRQLGTE